MNLSEEAEYKTEEPWDRGELEKVCSQGKQDPAIVASLAQIASSPDFQGESELIHLNLLNFTFQQVVQIF